MAKPDLRIKARQLRSKGSSINEISKQLNVSKSTTSLWVRDIILNIKQLETLRGKEIAGRKRGRIINAFRQKQKRLDQINNYRQVGAKKIGSLTPRELLLVGLSLYWAEGTKKQRKISFCNSDPLIINFLIRWLANCFHIPTTRLAAYVGINESHRCRNQKVLTYWSQTTKIPLHQFRKTSFKKTKNVKIYDHPENHYGTLTVYVLKPADLYYKILGQIYGLSLAG